MPAHPTPDLTEFDAAVSTGGPGLLIDRVLVSLSPAQVEKFHAAIQAGYGNGVIARVLSDWTGRKVSREAVGNWIRNQT